MRKNRFIALAMVVMLICLASPYASAAQTRWINADDVTAGLSFSGSMANCSAKVAGLSGTTKITATVTLSRKNSNGTYTAVKTWSNQSTTTSTLTFSDTYSVTKGYTYRVTVNANVTRNGTTESVSNWVENSL